MMLCLYFGSSWLLDKVSEVELLLTKVVTSCGVALVRYL